MKPTSQTLSSDESGVSKSAAVKCQICDSVTVPGLNLGHQPVADHILSAQDLSEPETRYPMQLYHCPECGLTQLGYALDPQVLLKNYLFVSGTTQTAVRHLQSLPTCLVKLLNLDGNSFAVDIGSNDGTLLKGYLPFGVKFLGVDPADAPARIARGQGVETLPEFFDEECATRIAETRGRADALTACGVFGHIADLASVMRGVKRLLAPGGVFASDSQYWLDTARRLHYDNIFHEHLRYYSLKPLVRLFKNYELDVFNVERSEVYGGSIRVFSCHAGERPISARISQLLELEEKENLHAKETNDNFARKAKEKRRKLFETIYQLKTAGKKIIGVGAPAKASTVCNYGGLGREFIDYLTEINPLRVGKFLPGVHIPILEEAFMFKDPRPVDAVLLFAWNYYDEIVPKLRARGFTGEILLP